MTDLVRLDWQDTRDPTGSGHSILPRYRAERLVHWILGEYGSRYELAIEPMRPLAGASPPTKEIPVKWALILGLLQAVLAFFKAHKGLFIALVAFCLLVLCSLLATYLPEARDRVYPVVGLALGSFAAGLVVSK